MTDIHLASALVAKGAKVLEIKPAGFSKAEFTLQGYGIEHEMLCFQNKDLMVDAQTLFETFRTLKTRANDVLRNTY